MNNTMRVEGFEEGRRILNVLPEKLQRSVLLKIFRKSTKSMIRAARANAGRYSQRVAKSIGNITSKNKKAAIIYVGPRVKRKWKNFGWFAHFIEYGTRGVKRTRAQSYSREEDNEDFAVWVGKMKKGERFRDDQPAKPFMRPAVDASKNTVKNDTAKNMNQYMQSETEKAVKKNKAKKLRR